MASQCTLSSYFTMGKGRMWRTVPKGSDAPSYCLVLGPLTLETPSPFSLIVHKKSPPLKVCFASLPNIC